jgi:hypothetical protein
MRPSSESLGAFNKSFLCLFFGFSFGTTGGSFLAKNETKGIRKEKSKTLSR